MSDRTKMLEKEEAGRREQLNEDGRTLLSELAQAEQEAQAAVDRAKSLRQRLDKLEGAKKELDEVPDLRPVEEEPEILLTLVVKAFPGEIPFDEHALVDPLVVAPSYSRSATVRSWFGGVIHPKAAKAQGVVCGACSVIYRDRAAGAEHWRRRHNSKAVERVMQKQKRDEADAVAQRRPQGSVDVGQRIVSEWDAERRAALHPRPWPDGEPLDQDAIRARMEARKPGGDLPPAA